MKPLFLSCCLFFLITACALAQPVQYERVADEWSWVLTVEYPEYVIRECRFDGKITIVRGTVSEANETLTFKDAPDTPRRSIVDGRQFLGKVEMRDNRVYLVEKDRETDFSNTLKEKEPFLRYMFLKDFFRRIESTSDKAESRHSISSSPLIADHDMGYELNDVSDANYMLNELDFREKYSDNGNLDIFIVPHLGYLDLKVVKFNDEPDITLAQVSEIHDAAFRFLREARSKRLQAEREQAKSTSGTTATSGTSASPETPTASPESAGKQKWATPNGIEAVSWSISFADMPMPLSKLTTDVLGDLKCVPLCGVGGKDGWSQYCAITDPDARSYYGIVYKYKDSSHENFADTEISSVRLYYCDEHNMEFYNQRDYVDENIKKDYREIMKRGGKTPWQVGVELARMSPSPLWERARDKEKAGAIIPYPIPLIDNEPDDIAYPPAAKILEPRKEAEAAPIYPLELRRSATSGKVTLYVKINDAGVPVRIVVKESTNDVFNRYAIAHALQTVWEYNEEKQNGQSPEAAWGMQDAWFESTVVFDVETLSK